MEEIAVPDISNNAYFDKALTAIYRNDRATAKKCLKKAKLDTVFDVPKGTQVPF
jgi:hypothetical protein